MQRRHVLAASLGVVGAAQAKGTAALRVLAWPGYAEPEVVRAFEAKYPVKVELTVIDTDEGLWQRLAARQGGEFDVVSLNIAELNRAVRAGLLQPVDSVSVPTIRRQLPRFQRAEDIPGLKHAGRRFGVPFTYSTMGLIYDKRQLSEPPRSLQVLWDPRWQGKVVGYEGGSHNVSIAAQVLGLSSPFQVPAEAWPQVAERLIALRRNVLGFYGQPDESVALFLRHGAALMFANYGTQQLRLLEQAGAAVGYAFPREGTLAWLDCWAISRGSADVPMAHAWIDHVLGDLASDLLVQRQGLANTRRAGDAPDPRLLWLEPVEDAARRERLWARVIAGDSLNKVLSA
ncbi:ABC transporter substrate-binding protein [Inhella gelatinilytica]|uniref:Extracellular solute-binding protein n=1 Tax=Inhella gelatinilytica TaxID=2795030 RepID=A0A931IY06_9BURK|nr:extracellular solute-binding protein [Inhella gelatinilytica]MBH9553676.1 extracellular solute-binding protein [Inhella gelatinilytica]